MGCGVGPAPQATGCRRERNVCTLTAKGQAALRTAAQAWTRHLPAIRRVVESAGTGVGSGEAAGLCCDQ